MITAHLYDIKRWRVKASIPILNDVHDTELGKTLAFPTFLIKKNTLYDPVTQKYQQSTREVHRYSEHAYRFLKHI